MTSRTLCVIHTTQVSSGSLDRSFVDQLSPSYVMNTQRQVYTASALFSIVLGPRVDERNVVERIRIKYFCTGLVK